MIALSAACAGAAQAMERAVSHRPLRPAPSPRARPMVTPFARALDVLGAYTPQDRWLGNRELAGRTGLPASTITRLAQCLVELGYLHYDPVERKYRLAASVLSLGYAAIANSDLQRAARRHMQSFADTHRMHVNLSSRERLDLIVLESSSGPSAAPSPAPHVGARVGIASSPMGWTLLAALPELERYYLMDNVERHTPREWPRLRRRLGEAVSQVYEVGYCTSVVEGAIDYTVLTAPVLVEGHAPFVLSGFGPSAQMSRARVQRELGPRLLATATAIRQSGMAS